IGIGTTNVLHDSHLLHRGLFEARRDVVRLKLWGRCRISAGQYCSRDQRGNGTAAPELARSFPEANSVVSIMPPPLSISASRDIFRQAAANSRRNFCRNGCCGGNGGQQSLFNQGKGKLGEQFGWTY